MIRLAFLLLFVIAAFETIQVAVIAESLLDTQPDNRPNILFCIADDASFPHMSAYGCQWVKTPGFDRVASQGLLFTKAYTPNAKCAPSRACLLTGRNSWQLKEACNHWCFFPQEFVTYPEVLAKHGYSVGKTGKGWAPGIANDSKGKRRIMAGVPFNKHKEKPPAKGISGINYAKNFEEFLDTSDKNRPWSFWYGGFEPHRRYEYGAGVKKGGKRLEQIDEVPPFWPDNEVTRNDMLDYAFEIEHFDSHLEKMLNLLEKRGELNNTIVVVTADNGMPFPRIKGQEYEMSNHLPLAIMWKEGIRNPGRQIDQYVSFIDLAPTFLEFTQIDSEESEMQAMTGQSLSSIFKDLKTSSKVSRKNYVLIGKERHDIGRPDDWGYPIRGIVKDEMLYLINYETSRWPGGNPETGYLNCDGSPTKTEVLNRRTQVQNEHFWSLCFGKRPSVEFYDLKKDPYCMNNLSESSQHQEALKQMHQLMIKELKRQRDPRVFGEGEIFDRYQYANLKEQNYYNRFIKGEKIKAGWVNPTDYAPKPLD